MSAQNPVVLTPFPRWLIPVGAFLACIGGAINAVCILSFAQQPVTHMTGLISLMGIASAQLNDVTLPRLASLLLAYLLGAMAGGAIAREQTLIAGRRYAVGLMLEGIMLIGSVPLLTGGWTLGLHVAAFAASMQNALISTFSGALIRTNHITGLLTDLGIYLAHLLMRRPVIAIRIRINVTVLLAFFAGGVLGALGFAAMGYAVLYPVAALVILFSLVSFIYRVVDLRVYGRT
jgi:uncharacterized membrane protein YoaK (UPF0700 family)